MSLIQDRCVDYYLSFRKGGIRLLLACLAQDECTAYKKCNLMLEGWGERAASISFSVNYS